MRVRHKVESKLGISTETLDFQLRALFIKPPLFFDQQSDRGISFTDHAVSGF